MLRFLFPGVFSQLPTTKKEIEDHVLALSQMASASKHKELFSHLYDCLSILDSKSSSLLGFNSIIIAVLSIFLGRNLGATEFIIVNLGMFTVVVSAMLLLSVVWVHWSPTEHLKDLSLHAEKLLAVRRRRTIVYRLAWHFSVWSLVLMSLFMVISFVKQVTA